MSLLLVCFSPFLYFLTFRTPFDGHEPYLEVKGNLLKICLELATNAQRDLFAEHPVQVKKTFNKVSLLMFNRTLCLITRLFEKAASL